MSPKLLLLSLVVVVVSTAMWKLATVGASEPPTSPESVVFTLISQSDPGVYPRTAVYRTRVVFAETGEPEMFGFHNGIWFLHWQAGAKAAKFKLSDVLNQQFQGLKDQNPGYPETAIRLNVSYYWEGEPGVPDGFNVSPGLYCVEQHDDTPDVVEYTITWDQPINGLGDLPATIAPVEVEWYY